MSEKAFVDTTILAEVLLKVGDSHEAAKRALGRYSKTLLPVYAIKEWKRGQFAKYVYIHNLLTITRSFSTTHGRLSKLFMRPRALSTAHEAMAAATLSLALPVSFAASDPDTELADRFRLAFKTLIYESWEERRSVASATVLDLECYREAGPRERANGELDISPRDCDGNRECCLATILRAKKDILLKLRDSVPLSGRQEDKNRKEVLRHLAVHTNRRFEREDCQKLGDAYFAIFAPDDADILTTNLKDHLPLATAIGKRAVAP